MEQIELEVTNRETLGKKVRFLRRRGVTPVHLFGHGVESLSLQCDTVRLRQVLAEAGHTRLVSLRLDGEKRSRNVVVREVQVEPRTSEVLHVDLYQVRMAEKMKVEIPIVLVGEAPALKLKENMLEQELNVLTVECLPAKIPDSVEVDISSLAEPDEAVRVRDVELDEDVTLLTDLEMMIVKISVRHVEKLEEMEVAEEMEGVAVEAPEAAPSPEEEPKE